MKIKKKYILSVFLVTLVTTCGLFALKDSFNLTLFGDDWLSFWRYNYHLGPQSLGHFNYLTYFLTVYGPEDMSIGIFQPIFHYTSLPYYVVSFILRSLAALSIFPLVYSLTKNKLSGAVASIFFAITFIGIETTNWVFNMPSYLAIVTFNGFLYLLLKRQILHAKQLFLLGILFYLTFIIQPIRMTGLPIIVLALQLLWLVEIPKFYTLKNIIIRMIIIIAAFLLVKFGGQSLGSSSEMVQRVISGISLIIDLLSKNTISVLLHPFIMVGSLFLPDILWDKFAFFKAGSSMFFGLFLPFFSLCTLFILAIYQRISKDHHSRFFFIIALSSTFIWTLLVRFIYKYNLTSFNNPYYIATALLGGYFVILMLILTKQFFKKVEGRLAFLSLSVTLFSLIIPWLFTPNAIFSTSHRYLILSGVGVAFFWACMTYLFRKSKLIYVLSIFISLAFVLQIQANHFFFSHLVAIRGKDMSDKIWLQLSKEMPEIATEKTPLVFYFEGNGYNNATINDVITFGFPPHVAIIYNIYHDHDRIPIPVSDYKELVDIVQTGKPMNKYGRKQVPLPANHIYAFRLEGRSKLVNITKQTRQELEKIILPISQ